MTILISDIYKYVRLSTAGYIDLSGVADLTPEQLRNRANAQERMPTALGQQFFVTGGWAVLGDPRHPAGTNGVHNSPGGLAATLFGKAGEKVLSVRGTEGGGGLAQLNLDLLRADLSEIGGFGIAISQLVDLVNLVLRHRATVGEQGVLQLSLRRGSNTPTGVPTVSTAGLYYWLEGNFNGVGVGGLSASDKLTVVGHSLGGHLAAMLHRLMPSQFTQAVVFNSARYDPVSSRGLTSQFLSLFGQWGFSPGAGFNNVSMFDSEDQAPGDDSSVVSSLITGSLYGPLQTVMTEANSHVIEPFMESLALHALIALIKPDITLVETGRIVQAVSVREGNSDERLLAALYKVLKGQGLQAADLPEFGSGLFNAGGVDARQKFYEILIEAETEAQENPKLMFVSFRGATPDLDITVDGLKNLAVNGDADAVAYRYALKELSLFAIVGNNTLYSPHNKNGELDLYDPTAENRTGALTQAWISDRAAFLVEKMRAYTADITEILDPAYGPGNRKQYVDVASGDRITLSNATLPVASASATQIVFGSDVSDLIEGFSQADRLYGQGGSDYLRGGLNDDTLEGGAGLDVYEYSGRAGQGPGSNDGADIVRDTDGKGLLRYVWHGGAVPLSTAIVDTSMRLNATQWASADGKFLYTKTPGETGLTDLVVTIQGDAGGQVTIKDWRDGDFHIYLREARELPGTGDLIRGDLVPVDADPGISGIQTTKNGLGNIVYTSTPEPGREDTLYGDRLGSAATAGEKIESGGGNDITYSDRPRGEQDNGVGNVDWIIAGAGRDIIESGAGNDLIEAGADGATAAEPGGDIVDGGSGNDEIYAESKLSISQAIADGNLNNPTNIKGDFIFGGNGDDWLVGARGNDILNGGEGRDLIVGAAGNDIIDGDVAESAAVLEWAVTRRVVMPGDQVDYVVTTTGLVDRSGIPVDVDAGEADAIYGGSGSDWVFARGGDDFVDAGADDDVVIGGAGSDVLIGANGHDVLWGDKGGNADTDGGDYLDGGLGNDNLEGNGGGDILIGGRGNDQLKGGAGRDIYVYNRGDGEDIIVDAAPEDSSNDRSIVVFGESISRGDLKFRKGSLLIDLGTSDPQDAAAGFDRIHFEGFNAADPRTTPVLGEIRFADGDVMTYEDILAQGFDLDGSAEDDIIDGTGVTDRINSFAGNDDIAALDGDDVIDAGDGDDIVDAGAGHDLVEGGAGDDDIAAFSGNDTVIAGDGNDIVAGDDGDDHLDGGSGVDQLAGGRDDDQMQGGDGDDHLDGGAGNDVLAGGAGSDAYLVYGGMGSDVVVDGEAGETSVLQLAGGMSLDNLVAMQAGDSLRISLRGLDDSLLIEDFYSRPQDWLIRDADGNDAAMADLLARPDPAGDFVNGLWDDLRQAQIARIAGQAHGIGWQSAGGFVFNMIQDQAYIEGVDQTTIETITQVSEPFGVLAVNSTRLAQEVVQGFGVTDGQNFRWFQQSFETVRQESDAALIMGGGGYRSQTQAGLEAMLTLKRDGRVFSFQRDQYSQGGAVISYDTGTEVVLAAVSYEYDNQSYNRLASVSQISNSLLDQTPNVLYGNRVRVEATQFTNHFRYIDEIIAGASGNRIQVAAGDPSYLFQSITLVDGGAGNDTIAGYSRGNLFYGNSGNDSITGVGSILIGGDGNDLISGFEGSRFVYTATEAGIDQISENTIYTTSYADYYYRGLGIDNWEVRAVHGGRYQAEFETDGIAYAYYDSYEQALAARPDAVITFLEPLPVLPVILRNDKTAIESLAAAGVLTPDVVSFGPGVALDDLTLTVIANEALPDYADQPLSGGGRLSVRWGDAGFDVAVPEIGFGYTGVLSDYRLGEGVEWYEFADGTRLTLDELLAEAAVRFEYPDGSIHQTGSAGVDYMTGDYAGDTLIGRAGDDWLTGNPGDDRLDAGDGNDFLLGNEGNDTLAGGDGDDVLLADEGDDVLDGGAGNDSYDGGPGADRYHFGIGSGADDLSGDADDLLVINEGLAAADLLFSQVGANLVVHIRGSDDRINIYDWFNDPPMRLAGIAFADGTFLDADAVEARLEMSPSTEGDDLIGGTDGEDVIDGQAGNDEIYSNGGIDIVRGGEGDDSLYEQSGQGLLDGGAGNDNIGDEAGGQFIIGGTGDDYVSAYGAAAPSVIAFNPGDGADTIYAVEAFTLSIGGGIGIADLALREDDGDLILAVGAADSIRLTREFEEDPQAWPAITLQLFGSAHLYDLTAAIAAFYDAQAADPELLIFALGDTLSALEFESSESSGLGGQLAQHYQQHGHLDGLTDAQIRAIVGAADFGFALQPLTSGLTLIGTEAADTLSGSPGNDFIDGLAGADHMLGGEGDDSYTVDQSGDKVVELPDQGSDVVNSSVTYTLSAEVENLVLTGTANLNGTGNALANTITGNSGANRLDGKAGADVLVGGPGNDVYVIDNNDDFIIELADEGVDTVQATTSYGLTGETENLTLTGTAAIDGTGNALDNRLTGNAAANTLIALDGDDRLDGKAGADLLVGGAGNDTYYVDQSNDVVLELAGEGVDMVYSSATFTLSAEVENLTLSGTAAIDGSGNAGANVLTGNAADNRLEGLESDDVLDGKAGIDILAGGAGNDRFVVDHAADITIEMADEGIDTVQAALTWTLSEHIEQLTLTGAASINGAGNAADNVLAGNNAANILTGLDGNDWLDGKGGSDTLIGGAGDDTHVVAQSGDVVIELAGEGVDTVRAGITWTLGEELENLVLTGSAGIRGTGNDLANTLIGNSGNNQLDGRSGTDVMGGGAGNDTYIVDDAGDLVIESVGEGVDWIKAAVSYTLPDEVENLTLTGIAAIDGTGNALNNVITGNAAANTLTGGAGNDALNGGAGADMLLGGAGDDFYTVDSTGDVVIELADEGIDTVNTSITHTLADHVENLALTGSGNRNATGNALDNIIAGNRGINILNGMAGNDTLAGGLGNDSYRFDPDFGHDVIAEDDATAGNVDRIQFGAGIAATDIALGRLDDDLVAHTADKQHSIRVLDWFAAEKHRIERIDFADGASWDMVAIESQAMQVVDMPGLQRGNDSASTLLGRIGNTILEGNGGSDVLSDGDGNNLYSGGSGDDVTTGGDGNDLFAGGAGNDTVYTGAGSNVIAYNAGGGVDTVYAGAGAQNTLSLGGGLGYSDLALSRDNNDLVLNAGAEDKVVLKDWYAGNKNLLNLQIILDASDEFDAGAADPVYNRRVHNFDFLGMVSAFDTAQSANPGLSLWALGDALTQYHLSGADDAALGGDLAYWYARNGGFTGIGVASAQQIIGAPGFGAEAQGLREFSGLQEGLVRLG